MRHGPRNFDCNFSPGPPCVLSIFTRSPFLYVVAFLHLLLNILREQEIRLISCIRITSNFLVASTFLLFIRFLDLALGLVCSTLQFVRYSVHPTKTSSQAFVSFPPDATAVMFAATDSSNKFLFMTTVSSRQGLVTTTTAVHSLLFSSIGTWRNPFLFSTTIGFAKSDWDWSICLAAFLYLF